MLSSADVAAYRDERLRSVSASSVIRELNTLAHAIDIARKEWGVHLVQNPVRMIRRPAPPRGRDRRLVGDEEQRPLDAADAGRNAYMRPLIILAVETAMRQGEMLSLTWSDIDLDKRIAHLDMTKNGESRDVPLSSRALSALASLRELQVDERVVPATKSAVEQAWQHLRARAGCADLRFHDLRHEGVSRLLEKGAERDRDGDHLRTQGATHAPAVFPRARRRAGRAPRLTNGSRYYVNVNTLHSLLDAKS